MRRKQFPESFLSISRKILTHEFDREIKKYQTDILNKFFSMKLPEEVHAYEYVYNSTSFTEKEKFLLKLAANFQEMDFKIHKMQMSYYLLDYYPYKEDRNSFILQGHYIEYVMEAYLTHFIGLRDRILETINFLYGCGFKGRQITKTNLIKKIKDQKILGMLECYDEIFDPINTLRNDIVHKYRFDIPDLRDLLAREKLFLKSPNIYPKNYYKKINKDYSKLINTLEGIIVRDNDLFEEVYYKCFFEQFYKQYKKRLVEFES